MKVRIYHSYIENQEPQLQVEEFKNVEYVSYEDQQRNGKWLFLETKDHKKDCACSIESGDWFEITK